MKLAISPGGGRLQTPRCNQLANQKILSTKNFCNTNSLNQKVPKESKLLLRIDRKERGSKHTCASGSGEFSLSGLLWAPLALYLAQGEELVHLQLRCRTNIKLWHDDE
eukprot:gene11365-3394_t